MYSSFVYMYCLFVIYCIVLYCSHSCFCQLVKDLLPLLDRKLHAGKRSIHEANHDSNWCSKKIRSQSSPF